MIKSVTLILPSESFIAGRRLVTSDFVESFVKELKKSLNFIFSPFFSFRIFDPCSPGND
jgi:hypothetical protein